MRDIRKGDQAWWMDAIPQATKEDTGGDEAILKQFLELLSKIPERDPTTFFAFDDDVIAEIFAKPDTRCSFVFDDDVAVAGGFIWRPETGDPPNVCAEHEGADIGLKAGEYLQLDNTVVLPEYRGCGLQKIVIEALIEDVDIPIVATVAPSNTASFKTLERCGLEVRRTLERRGGYRRHVMLLEAG